MARFETHTVGSQVLVLPKGLKFEYPAEPEANYVDALVAAKLKKLRISPSELCTDEVFLRRAYLDVIGAAHRRGVRPVHDLHRPRQAGEADRRAAQRKEFSELWVNKWAEILQVKSSQTVSYKAMFLYYNWLVEKLSKNMPMDQMVQELLGANGGTFKNPSTNFYQSTNVTLEMTENVAQVFMGMRIQCAQCHNHPFDRWTQDDYYGFAAFFSQIGRKQAEDQRETIIFNSGGGEVNHPVGGRPMAPKFLGGGPRGRRQGPPGGPGQVAGLAREPLVRHLVRQPGLGPLLRLGDRRAGRRLPGLQPRHQPRAARRAGQAVHRLEVRPQVPGPRHLQLADVPAIDPAEREQRRPTSGTSPTPTSGGSRPRTCSTPSAWPPTPRTSSRASPSAPGPPRSPTGAPPPTS